MVWWSNPFGYYEYEELNKKLKELTDEELEIVTAGAGDFKSNFSPVITIGQ